MTAQRLVRGSKARIIASLCAVVFCVGLLVLFQKNQTQLDNVQKNYENCVQQQESLSTQLQVIVDYKTRLEKSLQSEKAEHKQTRTELESRINDEKSRRDKTSMEANLRFQSLQQHYKLLQTKHDDLKEKSDKLQQQYLEDTDKLQAKIKEQQEQLKQSDKNKEKSLEHLKTLYLQLQIDKENLAQQLKNYKADHEKWESDVNHLTKINHQLQKKLEESKNEGTNNAYPKHEDTIASPHQTNMEADKDLLPQTTTRKFAKQVKVSSDEYQIQNKDNIPIEDEKQEGNDPQVDAPQIKDQFEQQNSVVLQKPSNTSKSSTKSNAVSKGNLNNARPLLVPTMTPSNSIKKIERAIDNNAINANNVLPLPNVAPVKKLPPGVVPVPKQELQKNEDAPIKIDKIEDKNVIPEEINLALPNRYRNNIIDLESANENKETKAEIKTLNLHNEPELNQQDNVNAAMEVIDQKNPVQEDPLHLMDVNEANEVKMQDLDPAKDPVVQLLQDKKFKKQHIDALKVAGNADAGALKVQPGGAIYENEGDYDKDAQKEDLQIEEADPEGEEDDEGDDYDGHLAARQKEPAIRN